MNPKDLSKVAPFCKTNPAFSESAIRWMIHCANDNGLNEAKAIIRIGRSVYIHTVRFGKWLEEHAA